MRAVSSRAVRITACVPFYPMATTRAEKPHARSLPSLPRRHIRHLRGMSWVSVPPGSIRPGSLPLSHFSVNPTRLEMATLIRKPQILTAQQFILRPLHLQPLTVVVQDSQDGNGICNGNMPSKSEPHVRTFCQVLKKPSRFLWRPTGSIKAFLRRLKGASMPQTHVGAPRSGSLGRWLQATACSTWQVEDAVRKDTQLRQVRRGGNRTPTDMRRLTVIITCTLQATFLLMHPLL